LLHGTIPESRRNENDEVLKAIGIGKPEDPMLAVFKIHTGEAHFWTMENNMRESEIKNLKF
jgi:pyridoxamine 5'-phosphate oxidase